MDLTPVSGIRKGSYVSTGAAQVLDLTFIPDYFLAYNLTQASFAGTPAAVKKVEWFSGMANDSALVTKNTASAATDETSLLTSGGITPFDSYSGMGYPTVNVVSVSRANPAVVTTDVDHNLATGDVVRLWGVGSLTQLNGLLFSVTKLTATTFSIKVDTSVAASFPVDGAGGFVRKMFPSFIWKPKATVITGISTAQAAVVQTSAAHGYVVGDFVRLYVPSAYGMVQANGIQVKITATPSGTTFVTDLNTLAFTAFKWPTQGVGQAKIQYAQAVPVGEFALTLDDPKTNTAVRGLFLNTGIVGAASDVWQWVAIKGTV